jgi:PPM family protein phosphatase
MVASARHPLRIRSRAVGRTDVGLLRVRNEDRLLVAPEIELYVVADGMGGSNAGDVAADLAVRAIDRSMRSASHTESEQDFWYLDLGLTDAARRLASAIRCANLEVFRAQERSAEHSGMGSTVVALSIARDEQSVHIAHVGDSRCYLLRDGEFMQLTRDHSLVNEARALAPHLDAAQLARLPRNVVSRALGLRRGVRIDIRTEATRPGDLYVLCSDGLSGMLNDKQILDALERTSDLDEACDSLVLLANEHGGRDNVTVILLRIEPDGGSGALLDPDGSAPGLEDYLLEDVASARQSHRRFVGTDGQTCTHCGARGLSGDAYCGQCGTRI